MTTTQQNLRKKNMKPTLFILAAGMGSRYGASSSSTA